MKKITKEEAEQLEYRIGTSTVVRTAVMHMQPGELLLIERKDWTQRNGPGQMLKRISDKTQWKFVLKALANGSGWIVERIE